jgi:carbon monoxide dehydrogenase subunit G
MQRFTLALIGCLAVCGDLAGHGPSRQKVTETITVNAPAAQVWAMVRAFCSIKDWHPGVYSCTGAGGEDVGATRVLTIGDANGPQIHEELLKHDDEKMSYKYKITKTANDVLPVTTYSSFVSVKDNGDRTAVVEWRGGFYRGYPNNNPPAELNDEAAAKAVTTTYAAGLDEIKKLAEQ